MCRDNCCYNRRFGGFCDWAALCSGRSDFIWQGDRWQSAPDRIKAHDFQFWTKLQFGAKGEILPMAWVDHFEL
jgi:hypothetical protein